MSEEQAQKFLYQLQMLEAYYNDMTQREGTLVTILREATSAVKSIKTLGEKEDSDALVPVGMGSFVKTKISSSDKLVLNIGAGVAIEKDRESALNYLEARIKEIEVALQETSTKRQQAEAQLENAKQQLNQLMQAAQTKNK